MSNKINSITAKNIKFKNNEPAREIKGGSKKNSVFVSRDKYPAIALREKINSVLLNHCSGANFSSMLKPEYEPIIQAISLETVTTGCEPAIRKKAIYALRHYLSPKSINILTELASIGEDEYVKSGALNSLGANIQTAAIPVLLGALKDSSDLVKTSARYALAEISIANGKESLYQALKNTKDSAIKREIESIINVEKKERKIPVKANSAQKE